VPIRRAEDWSRVSDVAERPQGFVRESVVVAIFLFRAEPDATKRIARIVWRHLQSVMCIHGLYICIATSMSHPGSVACTKNRLNCGNETAGRNCNDDPFVLARMGVGLTI